MSKVVFVGNVPYNMGEEQLIEVFKSVGQVVGFRLVFDRETGKPRGYGFCEFSDHETAMSAVRNLNNVDVGGRPLRIDLADSDPFLEGKTTIRGELLDGSETRSQWREREKRGLGDDRRGGSQEKNDPRAFLRALPTGVPLPPGMSSLDAISQNLATMNPSQLTEVLAQMKAFVISHPDQAKILLQEHPQLSYALFQGLLLNKIVDPVILQRMLAATTMNANGASQQAPAHPPSGPNVASMMPPPAISQPAPPYANVYQQQPPVMPPVTPASYYQPPPQTMPQTHAQPYPPQAVPPQPATVQQPPPHVAVPSNIDPAQRDMVLQVLALTPEQIAALPAKDRDAVQQVRSQFMGVLNPR
ncbi:hypothetical protein BD410DRAFT_792148 [Rickenella mellea]|uniref:RRM domain-containing protein n=1 Tax=Rickenella mellea TaxID=50990 RepID=A0A4Y7PWM3_9AGAM|nr:hypothetical protein BD410DRAFT_792148 [Rickenella mellea]